MELSKAIKGYIIAKRADGMSPNTIIAYETHFNQLIEYFRDRDIEAITTAELRDFLIYLRRDYKPKRLSGDQSPYKTTTMRNAWCAVRSLYKWAAVEMDLERPDKDLKMPKVSYPEIVGYSQVEVQAILKACNQIMYNGLNGHEGNYKSPLAARDRAVVLVLLDTGVRVSELVGLRVRDVNLETGEVFIRPVNSASKNKSRTLRVGSAARKALWSYINKREETYPDDPLFLTNNNQPMGRNTVRLLINRLGERAGVKNAYPHRFRHTFAIQFLRNGGDVFTLQAALGHSDWSMTRHYANIAQSDLMDAHRKSSPVDNWRL